jgi:hypothetical protein
MKAGLRRQRQRIQAVRTAATTLRKQLHAMLDAHLSQIMPSLLADVSVGMGVTVGIRTVPPPTAEDLDPNAEAILAQRTGVLDERGNEVRRLGLEK